VALDWQLSSPCAIGPVVGETCLLEIVRLENLEDVRPDLIGIIAKCDHSLPLLRPCPLFDCSPELFRRDPPSLKSPKASCLCDGEYGFDGWNEDFVGLAEVGGVGYDDTDACFEDLPNAGDFEVELDLLTDDVKCVPGPVSSLGSGAFKGSRRYLAAQCLSSRDSIWIVA